MLAAVLFPGVEVDSGSLMVTALNANLFSGFETEAGTLMVAALVGAGLGLVYQLLRPVIRLLTLPFALVTLGLLFLLVDTALLWLVSEFVGGYRFDSFGWVLATAVTVNLSRRLFRSLAKR